MEGELLIAPFVSLSLWSVVLVLPAALILRGRTLIPYHIDK